MPLFVDSVCPSIRVTSAIHLHKRFKPKSASRIRLSPKCRSSVEDEPFATEQRKLLTRRTVLSCCTCGCCAALNAPKAMASGLTGFEWYRELEANAMETGMRGYESEIETRKAALFSENLPVGTRDVLELGLGTGPNLKFYPQGTRVIGVEPNEFMDSFARTKAGNLGLQLEVVRGQGEALPLDDNSVDVVVTTLVLCTVASPQKVIQEVARVLRPGGRYIFIEHVRAPESEGLLRLQQTLLDPLQQLSAGGCHLTRDTGALIQKAATADSKNGALFAKANVESFMVPDAWLIGPHVSGVAYKSA